MKASSSDRSETATGCRSGWLLSWPLAGLLLSAGLPNWVGQGWSAETPKEPLRVLLVDGQQNKFHNWKATTPAVTAILQDTGRFQVDALTTPPAKAGAAAWTGFRPDFRGCDVVLLNYHGEDWPGPALDALEGFVRGGGGLVAFHAGGSSFEKRESFNRMLGLAWRNKNHGAGLALTDDGSLVRFAKGEGYDAGHGPRGPFVIRTRQPQHPVMQGWPPQWSHVADELWHGLRGPAENLEVLATAFSPATGRHEPMVWTVKFGRGRVFVTALGHNDSSLRSVGLRNLLARGCEWAGTGTVTLPAPVEVPVADSTAPPGASAIPALPTQSVTHDKK